MLAVKVRIKVQPRDLTTRPSCVEVRHEMYRWMDSAIGIKIPLSRIDVVRIGPKYTIRFSFEPTPLHLEECEGLAKAHREKREDGFGFTKPERWLAYLSEEGTIEALHDSELVEPISNTVLATVHREQE